MVLLLLFLLAIGQVDQASAQSISSQQQFGGFSSFLGPDRCLVSRTDIVPCFYLNRRRVQIPSQNEFGVYNTRYRSLGGVIRCQILSRNQQVSPIQVVGSANQVLTFSSPGYLNGTNYTNDLFVDYKINCGDGHLAFMQVTDIDLEPKNCLDPNRQQLRCRDYISTSGPFGSPEACGNDTSENFNPTLQSSLRVWFRSSPSDGYPGFAASVICFQPTVADDTRCSQTARTSSNTRRTQLLDEFNQQMRRHAEHTYHQRRRRWAAPVGLALGTVRTTGTEQTQAAPVGLSLGTVRTAGTGQTDKFRFLRIEVSPGVDITYHHRILTVARKSKIYSIDALYVLHSTEKTQVFRTSAIGYGVILHFFGPGALNIVGRRAYYRIYVPDDFSLSKEEQRVLAELTEPQLAMAREVARSQPQATTQASQDSTRTTGQQTGPSPSLTFHNQEVMLALNHEHDCNPVLRASARSIIEDTQQKVPDHLELLRRVLQASHTALSPSKKTLMTFLQMSPSLSRVSP